MKEGYPFNVRAYGLLSDRSHVFLLLSEELIQGRRIIKFPGGGLRYGEGPEDCVVREFHEETGIRIEVLEHFYTTGFFQASAFGDNAQVISIYYRVRCVDPASEKRFPEEEEVPGEGNGNERFFWRSMSKISAKDFPLPIDREVARRIREQLTDREKGPR